MLLFLPALFLCDSLELVLGFTYTFSESTSAPSSNVAWNAIASSSSGQILIAINNEAVSASDGIYYSHDFGYSWSGSVAALTRQWIAVACDSSGMNVLAAVNNGDLYLSTDGGIGWATTGTSYFNNQEGWNAVASDSTGQYLYAAASGIYYSNNGGTTWSTSNADNADWISMTCDSTGQYVAAAVSNGYVYTSNDYGHSFAAQTSENQDWIGIASDATGQYLIAAETGSSIFISSNYGQNFTALMVPSQGWTSVAASANFVYLVVSSDTGDVILSEDGGTTWSNVNGSPSSSKYVAISSSGQYISAVDFHGGIYTTFDTPTSMPSNSPTVRPSSQPSSQPTSCPSTSFPTSKPTSSSPTSQPSSNPTWIPDTYDLLQYDLSTQQTSTSKFSNFGCDTTVYLNAEIVVSYLDKSSTGYINITAGSGTLKSIVTLNCAPVTVCGSIVCVSNMDVSSSVSCSDGGSLLLTTSTVNANVQIGQQTYCTYNGANNLFYGMKYTLSVNPLPTQTPTHAPSLQAAGNFVFQASPNTPFYIIVTVVLLFMALAALLVRERDRLTSGTDSLIATCVDMGNIGYHTASEVFYIIVLFSQGLRVPGAIIIAVRIFSIFPASYFILATMGPSSYSQHYSLLLNKAQLFKKASLYCVLMLIMMIEPSFVRYLPWYLNDYTVHSKGFPDHHLFKVCALTKLSQLLCCIAVQIVVLVHDDSNLLKSHSDSVALILILLYLSATILNFVLFALINLVRVRIGGSIKEVPAENPLHSIDDPKFQLDAKVLQYLSEREALLKREIIQLLQNERKSTIVSLEMEV